MYIKCLRTVNFRNLLQQEITFSKGFNLILGMNAQGKTNIIEAIHVLLKGYSFRTHSYSQLIRMDSATDSKPDGFMISGIIVSDDGSQLELKLTVKRRGESYTRIITLQGKKVRNYAEIRHRFPVVRFLPDDIYLASDEPAVRRRFIDEMVEDWLPSYHELLKEYMDVLRERNGYLELLGEQEVDPKLVEVLDRKLVELGVKVFVNRLETLREYSKYVNIVLDRLGFRRELQLTYSSTVLEQEIPVREELKLDLDLDELKRRYFEALARVRDKELELRRSLIGPHRDRLEFSLMGYKVRYVLSQSQQNMLSLAMKIAKLALIKRKLGLKPLLIMDEPFAYVDDYNAQRVLKLIEKLEQVIVVSNSLPEGIKSRAVKLMWVEGGKVNLIGT